MFTGQERAQWSNWKEIPKICQEQEKEEDIKRTPVFSGTTDYQWQRQKEYLQRSRERKENKYILSCSTEYWQQRIVCYMIEQK